MQRVDVVVIGAGAMGSATAWWLARRGRSVALVEQFEQGHARGSSHGASRIFRYAYADPGYVRMAQAALPLWRELEDDTDTALLEITGGLDHGVPALVGPVASAIAACGVEHEHLTPDAARGTMARHAVRGRRRPLPGCRPLPRRRHGARPAAPGHCAGGRRPVLDRTGDARRGPTTAWPSGAGDTSGRRRSRW